MKLKFENRENKNIVDILDMLFSQYNRNDQLLKNEVIDMLIYLLGKLEAEKIVNEWSKININKYVIKQILIK